MVRILMTFLLLIAAAMPLAGYADDDAAVKKSIFEALDKIKPAKPHEMPIIVPNGSSSTTKLECAFSPMFNSTIKALGSTALDQILGKNPVKAVDVIADWSINAGASNPTPSTATDLQLQGWLNDLDLKIKAVNKNMTFRDLIYDRLNLAFKNSADPAKQALESSLNAFVAAPASEDRFAFPLFDEGNKRDPLDPKDKDGRYDTCQARFSFLSTYFLLSHVKGDPAYKHSGGFGNYTWADFFYTDADPNEYGNDKIFVCIGGGHEFGIIPTPQMKCTENGTSVSAVGGGTNTCCCNNSAHVGYYRKCVGTNTGYTCTMTTNCTLGSQNCPPVHTD